MVLICDMVIMRAERSVAMGPAQDKKGEHIWAQWMSENIQSLWREELFVARGVQERLSRGDEF